MKQFGTLGRYVEAQAEAIGLTFQPVDERTGVEIADGSETNGHLYACEFAVGFFRKPLSRSTGSNPAARMLRRISSMGDRRRPCAPSSSADTESMSSAPNV